MKTKIEILSEIAGSVNECFLEEIVAHGYNGSCSDYNPADSSPDDFQICALNKLELLERNSYGLIP